MLHPVCKNLEAQHPLWWLSLIYALPVSLLEIGLFYYWFAVADRYKVFLYEHLGAGPFDELTIGRYRMSGLVAAGFVFLFYTGVNWFIGRLAGIRYRRYVPPDWWRVWLCSLPAIITALLWIMTTRNWPVLPLLLAVQCILIAVGSLALALPAGRLAAERPQELIWLGLAGAGLVPALLLLRAVELVSAGRMSFAEVWKLALGSTTAGALWTMLIALLYAHRQRTHWKWHHPLISGVVLSYLLLPLAHYLLCTPPDIRYITAADNFFARNLSVQVLCFLVSALICGAAVGLQSRWRHRYR